MISYALRCDNGHGFDSWFQSAAAFDALAKGGHLSCAICGSDAVTKAMMTPRVAAPQPPVAAAPAGADVTTPPAPVPVLKGPRSDIEKAIADLRRKVEDTSDYVGKDFSRQARAMHLGDAPERSIYGEARPEEARSLIEDGVPLMPLAFRPRRKMS